MDELKSWKEFELINKDNIKEAFQRMCTYLFCYTYHVKELSEEPNHPGIETYPIEFRKKKYGFQCKHFENNVSYEQIKSSVSSLLKSKYKNEIDFFVLYCNKDLSDCSSLRQIRKDLKDNNISLKIVSNNEILRQISTKKYYIIYNLFFKQSLLFDNYQFDVVKDEEIESVIKCTFIDLKLSEIKVSEFECDKINNKVALIEGYAGSGKSVAMYYIYRKMFMLDKDIFFQASHLTTKREFGVFVDFKIHKHDCKKEIMSLVSQAERYFDNHKLIIFFDGFDEVSDEFAQEFSVFLSKLCSKSIIERVLISCRSLSLKKHYLIHELSDLTVYKINALTEQEKRDYAIAKLGDDYTRFSDLLEKDTLIKNVDDPLCLGYVIENITRIKSSSDVFEVIKMSIERKIGNKIPTVLEPQTANVFSFLGDLAFKMYVGNTTDSISLPLLHQLIDIHFPKLTYEQINTLITALESAEIINECDIGIVFKHKRIYEFFLIDRIFQEYLNDINILQKVNIFKEEDLFEKLFLQKLERSIQKTHSLSLIAEYHLFKTYMNENNKFGADENSIMHSDFSVDAICSFDDQTIIDLLESNSKIRKWVLRSINKNKSPIGCYEEQNEQLCLRILAGKDLKDYIEAIDPHEWMSDFDESQQMMDDYVNKEDDYLRKQLEKIKRYKRFSSQYDTAFSKVIEQAMILCDIKKRGDLILKLSEYELDCLCKTIFYPNLMVLLYDETVVNTIISKISSFYLNSMNSKIFLSFFDRLPQDDLKEIKQYLSMSRLIIDEYNIVFAQVHLNMSSSSQMELEIVIRDTIWLLENKLSCEEYADEVVSFFDFVRVNYGRHGKHFYISVFAMKFLASLLTDNEVTRRCLLKILKHKYLNTQLLAELKRAKPDLMKNLISKSMLSMALQKDLEVYSGIADKAERLFQISFIYSGVDYEKAVSYFYQGYSESVIRLLYSKDSSITPLLVNSYITVFSFLADAEKEKYLFELFDMINWSNRFTDDGVQFDSINSLAKTVYFADKDVFMRYLKWIQNSSYWDWEVAYSVLFTMLNNSADAESIWDVYSKYVQYHFDDENNERSELRFLLAMYIRSVGNDELRETIIHLIQDGEFKNNPVTLSWKEKQLFNTLCKDNQSVLQEPEKVSHMEDISIDLNHIKWEVESLEYWQRVIDDFLTNNKDIKEIITHIQKSNYPNVDGYYYDNWNDLLYAGLKNPYSREKFMDLLVENAGYCGFYCLIKAYRYDSELCVKLYKRYHQFCQLLTRL